MRTLHHKCDRCGVQHQMVLRYEIVLRRTEDGRKSLPLHEETMTLCVPCVDAAADEMVNVKETIKRRWERGNER